MNIADDIFEESKALLDKEFLNKKPVTYSCACRTIHSILGQVAEKYSEKAHPIVILVDTITQEYGHISSADGAAWVFINVDRMVTDDWPNMSPQDIEMVIFRISQTFAHEMGLYRQYLRNWAYYEGKLDAKQIEQLKVSAGDSARELLLIYDDVNTVIEILRHKLGDAITNSPSMKPYLNDDHVPSKRFLTALYLHLQHHR